MLKKVMLVILVVLPLLLPGPNLWADDDAIMDVDDNAAYFDRPWSRSTYRILYYGDDYQYAVGSGGNFHTLQAIFTTAQAADITGTYHVYVRWTAGTARATNAGYSIYDDLGVSKGGCTYDQRYNGGVWMFCDDVTLNAGRRGRVVINNRNVPTDRYVCADAVRFVRVSKDKDDIVDSAGGDHDYASASYALGAGYTTVVSVGVNAPSSGKVIVNASGYFYFGSANQEKAQCWLTTGTGLETNHSIWAGEPGAGATMQYVPFAITRGFDVSSGTRTYRLICRRTSGTVMVNIPHMTAIFVPAEY